MSHDKPRRDSHAADHESQYNRAHRAATARRDARTQRRRRGVRLGDSLPCSSCADGVRRWCGRERRPLARLHAAAAQLCLLSCALGDGLGPADGQGRRRFRTRRLVRRGRREEAAARRWRRWAALRHPDGRDLHPGALRHHVQPGHLRRARDCGHHGLQLRPRGYPWRWRAAKLCYACWQRRLRRGTRSSSSTRRCRATRSSNPQDTAEPRPHLRWWLDDLLPGHVLANDPGPPLTPHEAAELCAPGRAAPLEPGPRLAARHVLWRLPAARRRVQCLGQGVGRPSPQGVLS